jgi:hypothetical protein
MSSFHFLYDWALISIGETEHRLGAANAEKQPGLARSCRCAAATEDAAEERCVSRAISEEETPVAIRLRTALADGRWRLSSTLGSTALGQAPHGHDRNQY